MSDDAPGMLVCPKCRAAMRTYERNGVHVDHCDGCRGIFLDRGELERLIDAEEQRYGTSHARGDAPQHGDSHVDGHHGNPTNGGRRRRRGGFLGELFD